MYRKTAQGWTKHLDFIMLDILCLHLAFLAAYVMRHGLENPYGDKTYLSMLICSTLVDLLAAMGFNTYKSVLRRGMYLELMATLRQDIIVTAAAICYLFTLKESASVSRVVIYAMGGSYIALSYVTRLLWKAFLKWRMVGTGTRSLVLAVSPDRAEAVVEQLKSRPTDTYILQGVILLDGKNTEEVWKHGGMSLPEGERNESRLGSDIGHSCGENVKSSLGGCAVRLPNQVGGVPVVAAEKNAAEYVCREWVDEILFCASRLEDYSGKLMKQFMEMGVTVHLCMPDSLNPYGQRQYAGRICGMNVLTSSIRLVDGFTLGVKRAMDILMGIFGTMVTLLLAVIIGPVLYINSPGPIFFTQIRVGKNGRKFKMYKFRSMYPDAEERKADLLSENNVRDGRMFKLDYDPRIIGCKIRADGTVKKGIGNFIRDWSLDEFPQFINALRGEMSVVGTRPPTVDEWEKYELHHRRRLAIKPGITGLWQVSGRSNITDFEEVVRLDAKYLADWSIGKDIKIILQTVKAVLRRDGAK